jgi:hypothetical protein
MGRMNEQRTTPRFNIKQLIGFQGEGQECLWAEGIDISLGGISCRARGSIPQLTALLVMVGVPDLEGEHLVCVEGYVAHSETEGSFSRIGVKITRIYDEDRPYLEDYLAKLEAEAPMQS